MDTDLDDLAALSHALERSALALADDSVEVRLIAHELESIAAGQREALAIALSYLLRHRSLGTHGERNGDALADAIDAMVLTLRRTR
jgi:hypothetical protein